MKTKLLITALMMIPFGIQAEPEKHTQNIMEAVKKMPLQAQSGVILKELTKEEKQAQYVLDLNTLQGKGIIFGNTKKAKYIVTALADVDCGFCQFMHSQIDSYLEQGIAIRYLLMPRTPKGSDSYKRSVSVWCADDRKAAFTQSSQGQGIPQKDCDNPVDQVMAFAAKYNITHTPTYIFPDGKIVAGLLQAHELVEALEKKQ